MWQFLEVGGGQASGRSSLFMQSPNVFLAMMQTQVIL